MLKTTYSRLLACTALLAMVCSASAQDAAPKLKSLAIGGVKVGKTLAKAVATSGKADSLNRVAEAMDGQLMDRLHNTRKFQLVARADLDRVIEEQGLGKAGDLTSARYLMVLSIDDFQDQTKTIAVRAGLTKKERTVRVGTLAKIYDAQTLEVLETANIPVIIPLTSGQFDNAQQDGDLTDIALSQIARESAFQIANRVIDVLYPAKVVSRNAQEVTINRGDGTYIAIGQQWAVRGPDTVEDDPDTGVKIKLPGPELGKVQVKDVRPLISIADVIEERVAGAIAKGASMKLIVADPAAQGPAVQPTPAMPTDVPPSSPAGPFVRSSASAPAPVANAPALLAVLKAKASPSVAKKAEADGILQSLNRVSESAESFLQQRLQETGRFQLVAQNDLPEVNDFLKLVNGGDYKNAAGLFGKQTPDFIIVMEVIDFQDLQTATERPALGTTKFARDVKAMVKASIYRPGSATVVASFDAPVALGVSSNVRAPSGQQNVKGSGATDDILMNASSKIANDLTLGLLGQLSPVRTIDRTGNQVTLNLGGKLFAPGQFILVCANGKTVPDPDAPGRTLVIPGETGVIQITRCDATVSVAQVVREQPLAPVASGWSVVGISEEVKPAGQVGQ